MPKYIVRPYFGHDCNSVDGFNNGHYLSEIVVVADDENDAMDKAMHLAIERGMAPMHATADEFGDATLYWEFDHRYVTADGTEYTDEADIPLGDDETAIEPANGNYAQDYETFYLYQYIDFTDVRLESEVMP